MVKNLTEIEPFKFYGYGEFCFLINVELTIKEKVSLISIDDYLTV